jgi:hypothetical protein
MPRAALTSAFVALACTCALTSVLPACTKTANVADVFMALDANGDRKRSEFFTDTREIHCVSKVGIGRPGVTLEILTRQLQAYDPEGNRFFATNRVYSNVEITPSPQDGAQLVDFALQPLDAEGQPKDDAPFPPGRFVCEVRLDGELEGTAIYNIKFPPCPTSVIAGRPDKAVCLGFYEDGRECPAYGLGSTDRAICRCTGGQWDCGNAG